MAKREKAGRGGIGWVESLVTGARVAIVKRFAGGGGRKPKMAQEGCFGGAESLTWPNSIPAGSPS